MCVSNFVRVFVYVCVYLCIIMLYLYKQTILIMDRLLYIVIYYDFKIICHLGSLISVYLSA